MERNSPGHPKAIAHLWPLVAMGVILSLQIALLQVALNRLSWGLYREVFAPAAGVLGLGVTGWLLYRQVNRERVG